MNLKILLPSRIFAEVAEVTHVVVDTLAGALGILPHRLDCVAGLKPGILSYVAAASGAMYVAVDGGVLAKSGPDVVVSTRRALSGTDLAALHAAVRKDFESIDGREQEVRAAVAKMETALLVRVWQIRDAR